MVTLLHLADFGCLSVEHFECISQQRKIQIIEYIKIQIKCLHKRNMKRRKKDTYQIIYYKICNGTSKSMHIYINQNQIYIDQHEE